MCFHIILENSTFDFFSQFLKEKLFVSHRCDEFHHSVSGFIDIILADAVRNIHTNVDVKCAIF